MPFAAVAGGVASAATGALLNSALGSGASVPSSSLTGSRGSSALNGPFAITGPGANVQSFNAGDVQAGIGPDAQKYLDNLSSMTDTSNASLTSLLGRVDPAFGDLVTSAVQSIHNNRDKAISDLSGSLAKRRVLGSSFGQNAVNQTAMDFANREAQARSQGVLESIDATMKILGQRLTNTQALAKSELDQANFATTSAVNIVNGTQQTFQDNSSVLAQLAQANASGLGAASAGIANGVSGLIGNVAQGFNSNSVGGYDFSGGGALGYGNTNGNLTYNQFLYGP